MNSYSEGYDKGHEDAINGDDDMHDYLTGLGGKLVDAIIPTVEEEDEWREGFLDGWEAGKAGD